MWVDVIRDDIVTSMPLTFGTQVEEKVGPEVGRPSGDRLLFRHRDFMSVYIVRQGRGTHLIDGAPYGVARGDVYVMGAGMAHSFSGCDYLEPELPAGQEARIGGTGVWSGGARSASRLA